MTGEAWSPTDLRHTAAQRLADGGISHAGLSEFMGHSSDRVANVYFDASPPQAKRIHPSKAAGFWAPRVVTSVHGDR
ncbi:site-specific integrase [Rhizobium bangladeshense]|uniref:site-specific integrase n=1 Tax=Rhizobium bangladeshense TaxID=1138189 RepID=UPI002180C6FA|nr:site-specific integrase [Rhizobium bangladeshense]